MGLTQGVDAGLEVFVLCETVRSRTLLIFGDGQTLGQFGDFARCNVAQTFAGRLEARVEALGELVGRLADVQGGQARLQLAPAVHCRCSVVVVVVHNGGLSGVPRKAVPPVPLDAYASYIDIHDGQRAQIVWLRLFKLDTVSPFAMHPTLSSRPGQQQLSRGKGSASAQGDQHRHHHRRVHLQGRHRARRRHARDRRPHRRRQELRKGACPCPSPTSPGSRTPQIHFLSESIRCCGAGTAADTEFVTATISSNIELHALSTGRKPRVVTAMTMLKQHLYRSVRFPLLSVGILNPSQIPRAHRRCTRPRRRGRHRSTPLHDPSLRFHGQAAVCDDGIGKPCSHGRLREHLEAQLDGNLTLPFSTRALTSPPQREQALQLVTAAISAGIFNDLGSGSNVDACVITAAGTEMLRNFVKPNERVEKERKYIFRRGTTAWKSESIRNLIVDEQVTPVVGEAMDVS